MTSAAWPYTDALDLEGRPTREQQLRLEDFLSELMFLSRKYGLLIDTYGDLESPVVRDLTTGTIVGLRLVYFVDPQDPSKVVSYDFDGASILDGIWMVDTPTGPKELREVDGRAEMVRKNARRGVPRGS